MSLAFSADFWRRISDGFIFLSNELPGLSEEDDEENVPVVLAEVIIIAETSFFDDDELAVEATEGTIGGSIRRICFGGGLQNISINCIIHI